MGEGCGRLTAVCDGSAGGAQSTGGRQVKREQGELEPTESEQGTQLDPAECRCSYGDACFCCLGGGGGYHPRYHPHYHPRAMRIPIPGPIPPIHYTHLPHLVTLALSPSIKTDGLVTGSPRADLGPGHRVSHRGGGGFRGTLFHGSAKFRVFREFLAHQQHTLWTLAGGDTLWRGGSAKFPTAKFTTVNLTWSDPPPLLWSLGKERHKESGVATVLEEVEQRSISQQRMTEWQIASGGAFRIEPRLRAQSPGLPPRAKEARTCRPPRAVHLLRSGGGCV